MANRDKTDQSLKVTEGTASSTVAIKPGETMSNICPSGCEVTPGKEVMKFAGKEVVTIEGGKLVVTK